MRLSMDFVKKLKNFLSYYFTFEKRKDQNVLNVFRYCVLACYEIYFLHEI